MSTDHNIICDALKEIPPGTLLSRRLRDFCYVDWSSSRGGELIKSTNELRMVIHVELKQHPTNWSELCITTLGSRGIQKIELEKNDLYKLWKRV